MASKRSSKRPSRASRSSPKRSKKRPGNWIAEATKNKGALHRALGVPEDQPIPESKLRQAENSKNPTMRRRAKLARTLAKLRKKK